MLIFGTPSSLSKRRHRRWWVRHVWESGSTLTVSPTFSKLRSSCPAIRIYLHFARHGFGSLRCRTTMEVLTKNLCMSGPSIAVDCSSPKKQTANTTRLRRFNQANHNYRLIHSNKAERNNVK